MMDSAHRTRLLRFDQELNFLGVRAFEQEVTELIAGNEDIMYVVLKMDQDFREYIYNGDTIVNNNFVDFTGYTFFSKETPLLLTYDIRKDSITSARRFGSIAENDIKHVGVDDEGNLFVCGTTEGVMWISFDGIDTSYQYTTPENSGNWFINKFDIEGNHIYGRILPFGKQEFIFQMEVYKNDIYLLPEYYGSSKVVDGVVFNSPEETSLGSQGCVVKLDGETGTAIWGFELEGTVKQESFRRLDIRNDTMMLAHLAWEGSLWFEGNEYSTHFTERLGSYLWLTTESGKLVDYRTLPNTIRDLVLWEIKQVDDSTYDIFIQFEGEHEVFEDIIGEGKGYNDFGYYFLRIQKEGSLVTTKEILDNLLTRVYPNPTVDVLFVDESWHGQSYVVFDMMGKEVLSGKVGQEGIKTSFLKAGTYSISVDNQKSMLFIKNQ